MFHFITSGYRYAWSRCEMPFNRFHIEQNWSHRQPSKSQLAANGSNRNWITEPEWTKQNDKQINHTHTHTQAALKSCVTGWRSPFQYNFVLRIESHFCTCSPGSRHIHNSQVLGEHIAHTHTRFHGAIFISSPISMQTLNVYIECWAASCRVCVCVCSSWDCVIVLRC